MMRRCRGLFVFCFFFSLSFSSFFLFPPSTKGLVVQGFVGLKAEQSAAAGSVLPPLALSLFCLWHGLVIGWWWLNPPSFGASSPQPNPTPSRPKLTPFNPSSLLSSPSQCMFTQAGIRRDSLDVGDGCFILSFIVPSLVLFGSSIGFFNPPHFLLVRLQFCGGVAQSVLLNLP